jgi:transcriptional regulator with GAF, ATPase, and Fis domain
VIASGREPQLERILLDLAGRFAQVPSSQLPAEIEGGLKAVAECLGAVSCALVERPDEPESARGERPHAPAQDAAPERSAGGFSRPRVAVPIRMSAEVLGTLVFDLDARSSAGIAAADPALLEAVAGVFAHGLGRVRAETQLAQARSFEQLLADLSALVARGPPAQLERALADGLQRMAAALQLEQLVLLELAAAAGEPRPIACASGAVVLALPAPLRRQRSALAERLAGGEAVAIAQGAEDCALPASGPADAPDWLVLPLPIRGAPLCALCASRSAGFTAPLQPLRGRLELAGAILASRWVHVQAQRSSAHASGASEPAPRPAALRTPQGDALERGFESIIGQSDLLRYVLFKVDQVAPTNATTLLLGETGTGKGLIARTIHARGPRAVHSLVTVNCAALPAGLIEAELFGREKGAFTGAHRSQPGRFELAHRGTILLDEIGDLPLELQPKLLRVLQEGEFERVGSTQTRKVDVRVIAATNRNLEEDVRQGRFREDLYYRLSVFPITLPALRERREDIPDLVRHLVARLSLQLGKAIERIPRSVLDALQGYAWPGNVRELENVLTRALIVSNDMTLNLAEPLPLLSPLLEPYSGRLAQIERAHICQMLSRYGWLIEGPRGAASALGMNPSTLRGRMRKLQILRPA